MAEKDSHAGDREQPAPQQTQDSRQSTQTAQHGAGSGKTPQPGAPSADRERSRRGIGSSQGQDREAAVPEGGDNGTPDLERASETESEPGARESLVKDPTGAFKERP